MEPSLQPAEIIKDWLGSSQSKDLSEIMSTLLQLEKAAKQGTPIPIAAQLLGTWQLHFIGGKQSPNIDKASFKGTGKIVPGWVKIQLTYQAINEPTNHKVNPDNQGQIINRVQLGAFSLELSGPWMYAPQSRIMAFDFLYLKLACFGRSLLSIPVRGGETAEAKFWEQPLKEKAFFRYFWVTPEAIAARGKGGGIALWRKEQAV